ncbi:hypothetical protein MKEN_01085200 [Mycena kentingensis (nom. inval.)]|nr:hypothetical protein MKEN_01085200 [Mycena kentingensis (nom. inval.)]
MAFYTLDGQVKRDGHAFYKKAGVFSSLRSFSPRWLVLRPTSLCVYKNAMALDCVARISLNALTRMERTQLPRRMHCLLIEAAGSRYYLSFKSDLDLYSWHDNIYGLSPLTLFKATNTPAELDLENIISEYSTPSSEFSQLTPTNKLRSKQFLRPSPASSRVLLTEDGDDVLPSPTHVHSHSYSYSTTSLYKPTHARTNSSARPTPSSTPIPRLPLRIEERQLLREAVVLLCNTMEPRLLRKSDPGGEKPSDLVEMRLRALTRLRRRWGRQPSEGHTKNSPSNGSTLSLEPSAEEQDDEEMRVFSDALRDGYVLCQLLNTLNGNAVVRPDDRAASSSTINITKFLATAAKFNLDSPAGTDTPQLFLPLDLEDATGYSLARVAKTIIGLIKANATDTMPIPRPKSPQSKAPAREAPPQLLLSIPERAYGELLGWQTSFERQTWARMAACGRADGEREEYPTAEFPNSKVYQHLIAFVAESKPAQNDKFQNALQALVKFMASLDLVWSLVQSSQVRVELIKITSIFGLSNDRNLRLALEKDEADLGKQLQRIIVNEGEKKKLLQLRAESAQSCVDLIQDVLDKGTLPVAVPPLSRTSASSTSIPVINEPDPDNSILRARRLLVKLSEASDTLPASLFIRGVLRVDKEATFGGTFGDIYRATYQDGEVALKRIRVFQRDSGRHRIRQRFCREALLWQRLEHPFVLPFTGIDAESFPSFLRMAMPMSNRGCSRLRKALHICIPKISSTGISAVPTILVNDRWQAQLADFGLAVFSDATIATQTSNRGGSVRWMSPELHLPQSCGLDTFRRTFASDVYSFAFVCVELTTGKPPFPEMAHDTAVMLRVMAKERPDRPCDEQGRWLISDWLWAIVQACWKHDVAERPTMALVVEMMQQGNPELRLATPSEPPLVIQRTLTTRRRTPAAPTTIYQSLSF